MGGIIAAVGREPLIDWSERVSLGYSDYEVFDWICGEEGEFATWVSLQRAIEPDAALEIAQFRKQPPGSGPEAIRVG